MQRDVDSEYLFWEADFEFVFSANHPSYKILAHFADFEDNMDLKIWRGLFLWELEIRAEIMKEVEIIVTNEIRGNNSQRRLAEDLPYGYVFVGTDDPQRRAGQFFTEILRKNFPCIVKKNS